MRTSQHGQFGFPPVIFFGLQLALLLSGSLAAVGAAPANDNFANRIALSGTYATTTGSNLGATLETGEPTVQYGLAYHTVWWSWTAPSSGVAEINTIGSDFDTMMAIYTGAGPVSTLTKIASNDDYTNFQSRIVFSAVAGTTYHVQVDGFNGYVGQISLTVRMAPSVSITAPSNGEIFMIPPGEVTISADASAFNATITSVEFYQGTTLIGQASQEPFTIVWSNVPEGDYVITARAFDSGSLTNTSTPVSIYLRTYPPPVVNLLSPTNGASFIVPGPVFLSASAVAMTGTISRVEFFAGTNKLGEKTVSPYSMVWSNVFPGAYAMTAKATDSKGGKAISTPVNITVVGIPPVVSLVSPTAGQSFTTPGTMLLNATATAVVGTLARVEFFQGSTKIGQATTPPYSLIWSNMMPGNYVLTARATDSYGDTNSSVPVAVTVVLGNNFPPVASISSPADGAKFGSPANILVTTSVTDVDTAIATVEFFQNGSRFAVATNAPFTASLNNVGVGTYTLSLRAIDILGASATSAPVTITVTNSISVEWVAYNDHMKGLDSNPNDTFYTSSQFGLNSGPLTNVVTRASLPVSVEITNTPGLSVSADMSGPAPGTPAYEIFNDYIDWENNPSNDAMRLTSNDAIGYTFTGLSPNKIYRFIATSIRGGEPGDGGSANYYSNRWTKAEILGAAGYIPAHSANVLTASKFPGSLTGSQAAWNAGVNHTPSSGDVIEWDNIIPGTGGSFTVLCTKYNGAFPGGNAGNAAYSFAFTAFRLEQMSGPLTLEITKPANRAIFGYPSSISVSASIFGQPLPTNVQFYANGIRIGSRTAAPYSILWTNVPIGSHQLTAVGQTRSGAITSAVVNVSLIMNTPPTVSIVNPATGSSFAGPAYVTISAAASDREVAVGQVEFFRNGYSLGTVVTEPFVLNEAYLPLGMHRLTAVATDGLGARATSAPVNITITGTASPIRHVVHISVDALGALWLQDYLANTPGQFPNFMRLVNEGSYTLNARCDYFSSITIPNHASIMTSRPVQQPEGQPDTVHHGYTGDFPTASENLQNSGNQNIPYKASSFDMVHDAGLSTALYASKGRFAIYIRSWNDSTGAPDLLPPDNGRNKMDFTMLTEGSTDLYGASEQLVDSLLSNFAQPSPWAYTFLHFAETDYAGHNTSWGSTTWHDAVVHVDGQLGRLFHAIQSNPALAGHTALVVTADHGGQGTGHGDYKNPYNYTVPIFVWGPGIPAGVDLYSLFSNRREPTGRPDFNAHPQPLRNADTGNLALLLLGMPLIPGSSEIPVFNHSVALEMAKAGGTSTVYWSVNADAYTLESANSLSSPQVWSPVSGVTPVGSFMTYSFSSTPGKPVQFFRLRR